jgi:type IX secretion system PorP/SprF family membrane protein
LFTLYDNDNKISLMRKKLLIICIFSFFVVSFGGYAQQDPQFSHNMFNHLAVNPGFAGSSDKVCVNYIYRDQWQGFEGSPVTNLVSAHMPLRLLGTRSGVGLSFIQEDIGFENNFYIKASYAYHTSLADGTLGIGLDLGMFTMGFGKTDWRFPEEEEAAIKSLSESSRFYKFDMGIGAFYQTEQYYVALSSNHINRATIQFEDSVKNSNSDEMETFIGRNYFLSGGYTFQTPIALLEVEPSVFIKAAGIPREGGIENSKAGLTFQYDVNLMAIYNKKFWGGVTYRYQDAFVGFIGLELYNGIKVGTAYDFTTSRVRKFSDNSIEFYINYCFDIGWEKIPSKYKSGRYL